MPHAPSPVHLGFIFRARSDAMWWTKGIFGVALLVTGFLASQPAIVERFTNVLGF